MIDEFFFASLFFYGIIIFVIILINFKNKIQKTHKHKTNKTNIDGYYVCNDCKKIVKLNEDCKCKSTDD